MHYNSQYLIYFLDSSLPASLTPATVSVHVRDLTEKPDRRIGEDAGFLLRKPGEEEEDEDEEEEEVVSLAESYPISSNLTENTDSVAGLGLSNRVSRYILKIF